MNTYRATPENLKDRFKKKFSIPAAIHECWVWRGAKTRGGYGVIGRTSHKTAYAHRVSHEIYRGPIPEGLQVDHLCRNRACVNPTHLDLKTRLENLMAPGSLSLTKTRKDQTHCKREHEFDLKNTYIRKNGTRSCRACKRVYR